MRPYLRCCGKSESADHEGGIVKPQKEPLKLHSCFLPCSVGILSSPSEYAELYWFVQVILEIDAKRGIRLKKWRIWCKCSVYKGDKIAHIVTLSYAQLSLAGGGYFFGGRVVFSTSTVSILRSTTENHFPV